MRADPYQKWIKLAAVLSGILLAIAAVTGIFLLCRYAGRNGRGSGDPEAEVQTELFQETEQEESQIYDPPEDSFLYWEEEEVVIDNINEYAAGLGWNAVLLQQSLSSYVKENGIGASSGTIFQVLVPDQDPDSSCYYVVLDDDAQTVCILALDHNDMNVTASACQYTKEEALRQTLEEELPAVRDITPEEDAAGAAAMEETAGNQEGGGQ